MNQEIKIGISDLTNRLGKILATNQTKKILAAIRAAYIDDIFERIWKHRKERIKKLKGELQLYR